MLVAEGTGAVGGEQAPAADDLESDRDETLVAHFARVVRACGARTALVTDRWQPTYAELDATANAVAGGILRADGGAGDRIAILMEHEGPQVAAMLGAVKAGRICVALDPGNPAARLRQVIDDAEPHLVIADAAHRDLAAAIAGRCAVAAFADLAADGRAEAPALRGAPLDTAALVYTSGTTGRPKAVMLTHRHIRHLAMRLSRAMGLGPGDRVALLAAAAGAQGNCTAWQALLIGAALHPFATMQRGVTGLAGWLLERRITAYVSSASLLRNFMRTLDGAARFPAMRVARVASEMATGDDFRSFWRHFPAGCRFLHSLAASEVGAVACLSLTSADAVGDGRLPVGRPLDGIAIRLLGEDGREVPPGTAGEIVVSCRAMAAGYWRNAELTAQRFSESADGVRSFRSGDRGLVDADGMLTFLGRQDARVKIRGTSVELSEIEEVLLRLPSVERAVACTFARPGRELQLAAYVVLRPGAPQSAGALRRALRAALPAPMVPSAFVFVDSIPLTERGKVDRERLAREHPAMRARAPGEAPRTPTETLLAEIWAAAFDVAEIARGADFFELGGDSLTAAIVAARVHGALGVELSLGVFVEHHTLADLAAAIDAKPRAGGAAPPALRALEARPASAPLSFAQERVWRYSQTPQQSAGYTLASSYVISGPLDVAALRGCIGYLAGRHEILRTTFHAGTDGSPRQVVHAPAPAPLPLHDLFGAPDAEERAALVLEQEAARVPDLARLPLSRFSLIRLREDEHWLVHVGHHIISDGWSWNLYFRELAQLYGAHVSGAALPLPALAPLQYGDYARWQRELLQPDGPAYAAALAWWRARYSDSPAATDLPFRRTSALQGLDPAEGRVALAGDPQVAAGLDALARRHGATHFMVRLAAFVAVLAAETGRHDVMIGTYFSNRNQAGLRDLFGYIANLATLRFRVEPRATFAGWLAAVRSTVVEVEAQAQIPYELLRADLRKQGVALPDIRVIANQASRHAPVQLGEARMTWQRHRGEAMPWGFSLNVSPMAEEQGDCALTFDAGVYPAARARALLERLLRVLAHAARDPDATLETLLAQSRA